ERQRVVLVQDHREPVSKRVFRERQVHGAGARRRGDNREGQRPGHDRTNLAVTHRLRPLVPSGVRVKLGRQREAGRWKEAGSRGALGLSHKSEQAHVARWWSTQACLGLSSPRRADRMAMASTPRQSDSQPEGQRESVAYPARPTRPPDLELVSTAYRVRVVL